MGTSDWIAVGALLVSFVLGGLSWLTARRSAAAAESSAEESAASAAAAERSAEVAERGEERALTDREDTRGPTFHVGDRLDQSTATLNGDTATVRVVQLSGPELDRVIVRVRGPVDGVQSPEGAGGHSLTWDRPTLHVPKTVLVVGNRPDKVLDGALLLHPPHQEHQPPDQSVRVGGPILWCPVVSGAVRPSSGGCAEYVPKFRAHYPLTSRGERWSRHRGSGPVGPKAAETGGCLRRIAPPGGGTPADQQKCA